MPGVSPIGGWATPDVLTFPRFLGLSRPLRVATVGRMRYITAGIATLLAALLVAPAIASAAPWARCNAGDFCLFRGTGGNSGTYHYSGSDSNLFNDRFEVANTDEFVANNTYSAWNNGRSAGSGGYIDVLVSNGPGGAVGCIQLSRRGNIPEPYAGDIESYRWVTRSQCLIYNQVRLTP